MVCTQLLESIFGSEEVLNDDDKFLKDYLKGQKWIVTEEDQLPDYDLEEEEDHWDKAEEFEAAYNFRFQVCLSTMVE